MALTITQYTRTMRKQPTLSWTNRIGAVIRTARRSLIYPGSRAKRPFSQFSNTILNYNRESTISSNYKYIKDYVKEHEKSKNAAKIKCNGYKMVHRRLQRYEKYFSEIK